MKTIIVAESRGVGISVTDRGQKPESFPRSGQCIVRPGSKRSA